MNTNFLFWAQWMFSFWCFAYCCNCTLCLCAVGLGGGRAGCGSRIVVVFVSFAMILMFNLFASFMVVGFVVLAFGNRVVTVGRGRVSGPEKKKKGAFRG
jgi:hypothetical protein